MPTNVFSIFPLRTFFVNTFKYKQSSEPSNSLAEFLCMGFVVNSAQQSLSSSQPSAGSGALNLNSPSGGFAYGMPANR